MDDPLQAKAYAEADFSCGDEALINRLQEPTTGSVWIDSRSIAEASVTSYRRRVVYLAQTPAMVSGSVSDNLTFSFHFAAARRSLQPTTVVFGVHVVRRRCFSRAHQMVM